MPKISAPKCSTHHPDRDLNCQVALEEGDFLLLAERGAAAGWSSDEVAEALIELACNNWFALDAERRMFEECAGVILRGQKLH
ncbi:hypothetical protein LPJGGPFB_02531 [Ensifer adhaerens]|nr:hypothetical protein [Ensifer adhaerens]